MAGWTVVLMMDIASSPMSCACSTFAVLESFLGTLFEQLLIRHIFAPKWLCYGTPSFQQNAAFTCILPANWFSLLDHSAHKVKRSPFLAPNCRLNVWERSPAHSCTKLHIMRLLIWPLWLNQAASSQETQTAQFENIGSYIMVKGDR